MTSFETLIREAFLQPKPEIDAFFEEKFLLPLQNQLDTDTSIPAEEIRQKRIQVKKMINIFIAFANKKD